MERILDQLRPHADADLVKATISILLHIQRHPGGPFPVSWDALRRNFQLLQDRGQWQPSADNDELLDSLRVLLSSPSVVMPPAQNIPAELVDTLNRAYFLHVLATDPAQVLPPGKSLLSVMARSHTTPEETKPTLHGKVEHLVHSAFWEEAVNTLSDPEPSVQLSRIKLLYMDLFVGLSPLLPPKHPVLVTFSSPLSPTSSPLDSTIMHLREALAGLRERCAPVRDPDIQALQRPLDDPQTGLPRHTALAKLVVETVRNILKLSEILKDDLSQFVLGSMTEQQLRSVVSKQAKDKERDIVIGIWHRDRMMQVWSSWLDKPQPPAHLNSISAGPRFLWIVRVVQALGWPSAISCPLPSEDARVHSSPSSVRRSNEAEDSSTPDVNILPPIFFFSTSTLLKIQNYLQALVIAASLRVLTHLPVDVPSSSDAVDTGLFMSRVWTLLRAEIAGEAGADDTKIINLADEVVRARMQAASEPLSKEDEVTLRASVDRTLRIEDPVYKLLQRRLLAELSSALIKRRQQDESGPAIAPTNLRTGRDGEWAGKRPMILLDGDDMNDRSTLSRGSPAPWMAIDVKGFEDAALRRAIAEVFGQVDSCLGWVENVWSDVIETGDLKIVDESVDTVT